ncbi:MAG: PEGA domain-containing protein [Deltaproteobacteria bacterium]|nr:PEGA domain-containing protein [Deltaproteobacteria bacterium]
MRACFVLLLALAVPGLALAQQEPTTAPAAEGPETPPAPGTEGAAAEAAAQEVAPVEAAAETPVPEAASAAAPPVLVIPVWNDRVPAPAASAIRDAVAEQLRPLVRRREVQVLGEEEALAAARACADAPCLGAIIAGAGAISGVMIQMERRRSRDPVKVTLGVLDPVSGASRGETVEGEVPRDQIATPTEALAPLTSQLAALMPEPPRSTTLLVAVNVDGAVVSVDEQEVGESPLAPGAINPGEHTVTVGRTGYLVQSQRVDIARGQHVRLNFDLAPTAEQAAAEALAGGALGADSAAAGGANGSDTGTGDDDGGILTKWWLWAGVGGVVVLAVLIGVIAASSGGNGQLEAVSVPPIMP